MSFDVGSLVSSIAGLGVTIGTAIPGLRKPKKDKSSEAAAQAAASNVQKSAIGASQTGHGASRGLALRSGLRAASQASLDSATAGAAAADMDERRYQAQLTARNERIASLGAGIGSGLSQMAQSFVTPKKADMKGKAQDTLSAQPESAGSATGLGSPAAGVASSMGALESSTEGFEPQASQNLDQMEAGVVEKNLDLAEQEVQEGGPHANFTSRSRLEQLRSKSPTIAAPHMEEALENRLRAKRLMLQDAERLGLNLDTLLPMINRRFDLKPGQSAQNPLGVSLGFDSGGEK